MARIGKIIGTVIANRYVITDEIGSGGMGRVFKAIPLDDPSQNVAIKIILRHRKFTYDDLLRFQKEAALMSRLHHPHIISFHELGLIETSETNLLSGGYYIVMEVAQGEPLKQLLKHGHSSLDVFFQIGLQVSSALEYTHSKNIIHRDIKPQNIVVAGGSDFKSGSEELMVKVLDFGVAQLAEINDAEDIKEIAGTPAYMAPEASDFMNAPIDHRSDLYALGCVLYEILTGRPPFVEVSPVKLAREHANTLPEPITSFRSEIPSYVNDIVLKLLAKHPNHRYQTAFGLHVDLQRARRCFRQSIDFFQVSKALARYDNLRTMAGSLDLIGRTNEYNILINNYSQISQAGSESRVVVLRGEAGSGKSRILSEIKSYLAQHRIRYISASFSRSENLPFNALANGFNEYLDKVLKNLPVEAEEIRNRIQTSLGTAVDLVAKIMPGLKPFVYEKIKGSGLTSQDDMSGDFSFTKFSQAFSNFVSCLTSDNQVIVFVLDDIHWADKRSIKLIEKILMSNRKQKYYLIVSCNDYRGENPSFDGFTKKLSAQGMCQEVLVEPLNQVSVEILAKLMLNTSQDLKPDFVRYLCQKSKGNPLYLVELVRSLVIKDYIRQDEETLIWKYNTEEIKNAKVLLDSIDLTLNKIIDYDASDRSILEVASIIGTNFNFEMLLIDESFHSKDVTKAISKSMLDYLIVRTENSANLKHLGKSFSFSHHRIREAIKEAIPSKRLSHLHSLVASKMETILAKGETQSIFTLAHHYNKALGSELEYSSDLSLVKKALDYNILAGERASEINALVSAERYFRNASNLFPHLRMKNSKAMEKYILDRLGDIIGMQKNYSQAVSIYTKFLKLNPSKDEYARTAYKMVYYGMLNGYLEESQIELLGIMKKLSLPVPRPSVITILAVMMKGIWTVFWDEKSHIIKTLNLVAKNFPERRIGKEEFQFVKLYHLGQTMALSRNVKLAVSFHWMALKLCLKGQASRDAILRTFGDFGLLLGYLGMQRASYNIVDRVFSICRKKKLIQTSSYLLAMRTLTLDHFQGKSDDYEKNISRALNLTELDSSQQLMVQCYIFRMYQGLIKAKPDQVAEQVKQLPIFLRTRHWLSPRGVALYIFSLLLIGEREKISSHKSYLERRQVVRAQNNDLFMLIIQTSIKFAMGEHDKSYSYYRETMHFFIEKRSSLLLPYEMDFVMLFLVVFPSIMSQESARYRPNFKLIRSGFKAIYKITKGTKFRKRSCARLVQARIEDILQIGTVKSSYDTALKMSRVSGDVLIENFSLLWFGRYLLSSGNLGRKEYIYQAHTQARKLGLTMIKSLSETVLKDFRFPVPGSATEDKEENQIVEKPMSRMSKDLIIIVHDVLEGNLSHQEAFYTFLNILQGYCSFDFASLVMAEHLVNREIEPFGSLKDKCISSEDLVGYVGSYIGIRSALFIPFSDAPWNKNLDSTGINSQDENSQDSSRVGKEVVVEIADQRPLGGLHSKASETLESSENHLEEITIVLGESPDSKVEKQSYDQGDGMVQSDGGRLNVLIPVKFNQNNIGVLLLSNFYYDRDAAAPIRQELDFCGAYLGLWMRFSSMYEERSFQPSYTYRAGHIMMEKCSWLDIWSSGKLRKGRDSSWFLGVNLSKNEYLVVYSRLNGISEIREDISLRLWYHLLALRSLVSAKVAGVAIEDLYEEIVKTLHSTHRTKRLEFISLSFSILGRNREKVLSGHFGPSRPIVLGSSNDVHPNDHVIMTMENGRALRFWRASAILGAKNIYLSTQDSNRLDEIPIGPLERINFFDAPVAEKKRNFKGYLDQVLVAAHVPRFFVALTRNSSTPRVKKLDKVD